MTYPYKRKSERTDIYVERRSFIPKRSQKKRNTVIPHSKAKQIAKQVDTWHLQIFSCTDMHAIISVCLGCRNLCFEQWLTCNSTFGIDLIYFCFGSFVFRSYRKKECLSMEHWGYTFIKKWTRKRMPKLLCSTKEKVLSTCYLVVLVLVSKLDF